MSGPKDGLDELGPTGVLAFCSLLLVAHEAMVGEMFTSGSMDSTLASAGAGFDFDITFS